jgi:hypothetical protein
LGYILGYILGAFFTSASDHPDVDSKWIKFCWTMRLTKFWRQSGVFQLLGFKAKNKTRDRCYDHNFLQFFPIFGKKLAFFSKTNVMIKIFSWFSFVMSQKRLFFRIFFGENI